MKQLNQSMRTNLYIGPFIFYVSKDFMTEGNFIK